MEIENAKRELEELYGNLTPIIKEVVDKYSKDLDKMFHKLTNATNFTNDEIREAMLSLSVESYMFGMNKDLSVLKQDCAVTLMKEKQAQSYNSATGTQAIRNNQAIIDTTDKQVVNLIYSGVANMMKTKLDESHRMINVLNSILISRNAEAKIVGGKTENEIQSGRVVLNEDNVFRNVRDDNTVEF